MRNVIATALLTISTIAIAASPPKIFYENIIGNWSVSGNYESPELNPSCSISMSWKDRSEFRFIKDLADNEKYVFLRVTGWNLNPLEKEPKPVEIKFTGTAGETIGITDYRIIDNKSVHLRNVNLQFVADMVKYRTMQLTFQNNVVIKIDLDKSKEALQSMAECISKYMKPSETL